ncbi:hypothetical protein BH09ACT9_BH09ACT9_00110 [soil metagenome]
MSRTPVRFTEHALADVRRIRSNTAISTTLLIPCKLIRPRLIQKPDRRISMRKLHLKTTIVRFETNILLTSRLKHFPSIVLSHVSHLRWV